MALDCCLGGSRRILRRHVATSTTGFWLPRRRRRCCPVPTGTANFGPIGRPAQAINDAGKHSRKKTIKMMMEQTNSAEGPSINNVRPFLCHFYQPTFLLFLRQCRMEVVRKSLDSCHKFVRPSSRKLCRQFKMHYTTPFSFDNTTSCQEVVRQLSQSCLEVVRQLSQSCLAFITKVIKQLSGKFQAFVKLSSDCHQAVVFVGSCREVVRKFSRSHLTVCHKVVRPSS